MRGILIALCACSSSTSPTMSPPDQGGVDASQSGSAADAPPNYDNSTGPYFETPMFWNADVSKIAKAPASASLIAALVAEGGWGNSNKMTIDFAIDVLTADASTPKRTFTPTADFYSPDCDHVAMPVPVGGNVVDETG